MTNPTISQIPLNQLVPAPEGVRKLKNATSIAELAADIKAHGLMQNLVVRKDGKRFAVIAGQRRLAALTALVKEKHLKPGHLVPCRVEANGAEDSVELSLAENFSREAMHPADQFEAFKKLVAQGMSTADIAARFGRPESAVVKLLKLANVSPKILKAYRAGELTLEQVQAFAVTDDHKRQDQVLGDLGQWQNDPGDIRATLTEHEIAASDRRVRFVGLAEYEAAGGKVRRDLFAETDEHGHHAWIEDPALLAKLATDKLERTRKSVVGEGWKWVEVRPEFGYSEESKFQSLRPEGAPLPPDKEARRAAIQAQVDAFYESDEPEDEEAAEKEEAKINALEKELVALEKSRGKPKWQPAQLERAGAVITLGYDGKAEIRRGLVRPEDRVKGAEAKKALGARVSGDPEATRADLQAPAAGLSAALVEQLTAQRSAGLAAELMIRPDVALRAVVHTMVSGILDHCPATDLPLKIEARRASLHRVEGSAAARVIEQAEKDWEQRFGGADGTATQESLWAWCLAASQEDLLKALAFCAALTVDAVVVWHSGWAERIAQADRLAQAVGLDMRAWFTPTAANYFGRVSRELVLEALRATSERQDWSETQRVAEERAWAKLKKGQLAETAEKAIAGTGWLPEILRVKTG